jgi:hypothetical protein
VVTKNSPPTVAKPAARHAIAETSAQAEAPVDHPVPPADEPQSDQEIIQTLSDQLQHEAQTDWPKLKAEMWTYSVDPMFQKQGMLIKDLYNDAEQIMHIESLLFKDAALRVDKQSAISHSSILANASVTVSQVIETIHGPGQIAEETVDGFRRTDARMMKDLQLVVAAYEGETHEIQGQFVAVSKSTLVLKKADGLMLSASDRFDHGDLLGAYIAANHANLLLFYAMDEMDPFREAVYDKSR